MNIVVDDCHLLSSFFFVNFAEPDQQGYSDHFPLFSTPIFQGIIV